MGPFVDNNKRGKMSVPLSLTLSLQSKGSSVSFGHSLVTFK